MIDSAARGSPMAQICITDRRLRSRTTAAELEPLSYDNEEGDDLDERSEVCVRHRAGKHSTAGPAKTMQVSANSFLHAISGLWSNLDPTADPVVCRSY
jgi:hypothetical protein